MSEDESLFRWTAAAVPVIAIAMSGVLRYRAHQRLPGIPRSAEPRSLRWQRAATALPPMAAFLAYVVWPPSMAWAELPLPAPLRWAGAALAAAGMAMVPWVLGSLGKNVSETVLTRDGQTLVTHGPYRWVRHPLYSVGLLMATGLGLLIANGFMLAAIAVLAAFFRWRVIPLEERELAARFGDEHAAWVRRTGALLPRLGRR